MSALQNLTRPFIFLKRGLRHQLSDRRQKYETIQERIAMGDNYDAAKDGEDFRQSNLL